MLGSEILDVAVGLILLFLLLSLVCSSIKEALETVLKNRARDLEHGLREMFGDLERQHLVPEFYEHPLINALFKGNYHPKNIGNLPSYIPGRTFSLALTDLLRTIVNKSSTDVKINTINSIGDLRAVLAGLPPDLRVRGALIPLVDAAGENLELARKNIEDWYDGAMDRVSGWYKRRTQIIIACIGFLIAAGMNVDAIAIARYLNTNQTARSVLISRAASYHVPESGTSADRSNLGPSELADPLGWLERQGGLPVGWVFSKQQGQSDDDYKTDWRRFPASTTTWLMKIAGLLATAFAVSLGAPFWFDLLNRFMVIRSTVKPEEKSQNEPSKA